MAAKGSDDEVKPPLEAGGQATSDSSGNDKENGAFRLEVLNQGQIQVPNFGNPFFVPVLFDPACGMPMIPLHPGLVAPANQNPHQGGVFAVPVFPYSGSMPPMELIPFSYNAPLGFPFDADAESASPERADGDAHQHAPARGRGEQRQVVRRFRVGIQLDLLLIVKLVTMVFIFSQDGSRDKLLLLFFAGVVYLYQTGALTPILRWASERARRAMMPPVPVANAPQGPEVPPPDAGADAPPAAPAATPAPTPATGEEHAEPQPAGEEPQIQQVPAVEQQAVQGGNWRGFVKEMQMLVVGFLTSLLPGFHNVD